MNGIKFNGFLVSDKDSGGNSILGHPIYSIYDVIEKKSQMRILLALNEKNTKEVLELLASLNFPEEHIYQIR